MVLSIRMRSFNRKKPCDVAERENDSPENDEDTPSTSSAHTPSTSSARWARNRREKLKQDPEARKKFLASEAARQRERRAKRTEKQRERDRETGRIRQQRYEKRLSEGAVESAKGKCTTQGKKSKVLTRTEKKKKTEYNRIKQQERRARMNPQQKRRAREIDAKRRSEKRKENQGKQCPVNSTPPRTSSGFISKSAQRMAFKRLWERFPINDPEKFASIVEDFVSGKHTTPRKQAALQRRGIGVLSAKRTLQLGKCMTDSVKRRVQELKKKKDSASLKERRLLVRANLISKKYRMQSHLAKQLDVRPNYLSELSKSLDEDMMSKSRKRRSDATSMEVINEIQSFYRLPKVSRELPYMRTVKQQTQRRVMEVSIDQAYTMWKEEHPDHVTVVSRSLFQKLRPENVLLQHRNKLNQCLCEYCTDILLKLESLNRAAQVYEMPDIKVKNKYELIGLSMCPKNDGDNYAKPDCINRSCPECGTEKLRNRFTPLIAAHGDSMVQWRKWALQTYEHNGKTKAKKVLITQRKTISELVEELLNETETLAKHVFVANWQQDMFTEISTKLPQNWALLVLDFAENYGCLSQDEIQSAHWATQQVTVHPIVGYYNCVHSDATQSHIVQEAMVFISEDLGHDFHAVHHFEEVAVKHLKESRGLPLEHIVEYTDGCGCQYKSRGPFGDISYATEDYGVDDFERLYFGSRHGKGPSDGVSGVVKSAVRRAVVSRRAVINTAEEMYTYCKEELSRESCKGQRRTFFFVRRNEIQRERKREVKKPVAGTRAFHAIKCVSPGVIKTRLLGCFCEGCISSPPTNCANATYVNPWQRQVLKMDREIPTSHENQPSEEPSPNDTAEELSPGADEPPPDADEPSPGADKPSPGADEPSPGADKPSPDEESIEDLFRQLQGERDESDESEPDLDASLTNQVQNHKTDYEDKQWRIGDWVLAEYKGMYYPGIVKQIVGDETEIDCLEKAGKFWKWPDPADLLWYESHKVVRTLSAPFPISNRGQFKFAAEL